MAMPFRVPSLVRGVPGRFGALVVVAVAAGTWLSWPGAESPQVPAFAGKHSERLAFGRDESEIPVREARIYDTVAMFAQPRVEPRPWTEVPVVATMREAGIKPTQIRLSPVQRVAASEVVRGKGADSPSRVTPFAQAGRTPLVAAMDEGDAGRSMTVFGWNVPGSRHLPTRRDAERVLGKVENGAAAVGSGTARVVSRSADFVGGGVAKVGDRVMSTGSAIAQTLGLD